MASDAKKRGCMTPRELQLCLHKGRNASVMKLRKQMVSMVHGLTCPHYQVCHAICGPPATTWLACLTTTRKACAMMVTAQSSHDAGHSAKLAQQWSQRKACAMLVTGHRCTFTRVPYISRVKSEDHRRLLPGQQA